MQADGSCGFGERKSPSQAALETGDAGGRRTSEERGANLAAQRWMGKSKDPPGQNQAG